MSAFTPEAFGKYFLVDKIATGGMAEIFKAKTYSHGGFENLLVIKRILPHIGENEDFIEMFIDEAKVSVALQHPNIVRIYDFGKILENYFIAMECVDGKDTRNCLRKLARKKSHLPPKFAAFIAHETAKGLHYAHTKKDLQGNPYGIVHRDISPSNVIVSYEGEVKVADFGIAKAESNAYQTRDGVLKGKFEYMSPEQATGREIDPRSDIFSVGIILYEMLTGRRLFKTDSEIATLKKIRDCDFPKPSALNPKIPEALEDICMKALARYPEDRYQTCAAITEDLGEFILPATADTLRAELKTFMGALFQDEIVEEVGRLERGSEIAIQLKEKSPSDSWDGHTDSTMSQLSTKATARVLPWLMGAMALFLVISTGAVAVVGAIAWTQFNVEAATTGTVEILILPDANIVFDGELRGRGGSLNLDELEPGEHKIRVEEPGFESYESNVWIKAGEVSRFTWTMIASRETPTTIAPDPKSNPSVGTDNRPSATSGPVVSIQTDPSGASVEIDGAIVGTTPLTWRGGTVGSSYKVSVSKPGYTKAKGSLDDLATGATSFSRSLQKIDVPGKLTVLLSYGGWAHVYVDGKKLAKPAPIRDHALKPGNYTIRVENPSLGIDHTEKVTISSGGTVKVTASPK